MVMPCGGDQGRAAPDSGWTPPRTASWSAQQRHPRSQCLPSSCNQPRRRRRRCSPTPAPPTSTSGCGGTRPSPSEEHRRDLGDHRRRLCRRRVRQLGHDEQRSRQRTVLGGQAHPRSGARAAHRPSRRQSLRSGTRHRHRTRRPRTGDSPGPRRSSGVHCAEKTSPPSSWSTSGRWIDLGRRRSGACRSGVPFLPRGIDPPARCQAAAPLLTRDEFLAQTKVVDE